MSFSQDVKKEIAARELTLPCCVSAACYGIACFGRYFDERGVVLHTERAFIAQWAKQVFEAAGVAGKVYVRGPQHKTSYEFAVKDPFEAEKVLAMFGHTGDETAVRIRAENFLCEECFSAFVAAAFLCCGTIVTPEKGYLLEFVHARHKLMEDFAALLAQHDFLPGHALRKGANVLYFKASEQIEDLLTYMGASSAALEIMNLKVYKDFRNKANRIANCENANIDKIVQANRQVLEDIRTLEEHGALDILPQPLQQAAQLRRLHPALSLSELAELSPEPVSKSGLSHRYRKLAQHAAALRERTQSTPE